LRFQPVYDEMQAQHSARGHHYANGMMVNAVVDKDSWVKARDVRPEHVSMVGSAAGTGGGHGMQMQTLHHHHPHHPHTGADMAMSMANAGADEAPRAHHGPTHAERTLDKWEQLLRNKPDDPMAFYWREMIQWCKVRGSDTQGGGLEATGVKRAPPPPGAGVEEGVEVIDRLVKRIRCDDGPVAHPGSWA